MGGWLIAVGAIGALVVAFSLRTKLPAPVGIALVAASGSLMAWGGLLARPEAHSFEWVLAIAVMAVLGPAHVAVVLGRFGPRRRWGSRGR